MAVRRGRKFVPMSEDQLERVIYITGGSSGCSSALAVYRERRDAGEKDIGIWWNGETILIGPDPGEMTLTELRGGRQ